jgi:hypothetical protein
VTASIEGVNDSVVPGTPTLHVRYAGGPFLAFAMTALGGDLYQATLPPPVCSAVPEFYFSAEGAASGPITSPSSAPATSYEALVYSLTTVFADDFSANLGWTVENVALTAGAWQRGTPVGGGTRGDPPAANGGSGQCYLTENLAGNSDVDGGPTRLVSPLLDLSGSGAFQISYARWFTNDDGDIDRFTVEASNNGGTSWTTVASVSGSAIGSWVETSFSLQDFVTPTSQVRVRFAATDNPNDSVTEAGLDDFVVERVDCPALPDCNGNGILDSDDIGSGRSLDANLDLVPDECTNPPPTKVRQNPNPPAAGPTIQVP